MTCVTRPSARPRGFEPVRFSPRTAIASQKQGANKRVCLPMTFMVNGNWGAPHYGRPLPPSVYASGQKNLLHLVLAIWEGILVQMSSEAAVRYLEVRHATNMNHMRALCVNALRCLLVAAVLFAGSSELPAGLAEPSLRGVGRSGSTAGCF